MSLRATILGCGSSGGVPRVGGDWGACDPTNPKNRRRRCSLLLQQGQGDAQTTVLIDTSPDMREQMLSASVNHLDAVWYTHEHADHTHGIDELRGYFLRQRKRIPVWADSTTASMLMTRFAYCVVQAPGSDYPPILDLQAIAVPNPITAKGAGGPIAATPFYVQHGNINALGFRIGNLAYTPDLNDIPKDSIPALTGLDVWIVDALRPTPHPSHLSLPETLQWIERLKPKRAILTNMHIDLDYAKLSAELPAHIVPAHDGLNIDIDVS
jgi:phosphoribosyl 1,2-cyclic phosphate phosphodiesterase